MTIEGIELTRDHLLEPVLCAAPRDPERPTERGLLRGWDERTGQVYIGFWSTVLEAYRVDGYGVDPASVRWADNRDGVRA